MGDLAGEWGIRIPGSRAMIQHPAEPDAGRFYSAFAIELEGMIEAASSLGDFVLAAKLQEALDEMRLQIIDTNRG